MILDERACGGIVRALGRRPEPCRKKGNCALWDRQGDT